MYHIKNDKRSQNSCNAIYNGLITLTEHKPFNQITVSSICEVSNVSRATFYRNFDIIEDIFIWRIDNLINEIVDKYQNRDKKYSNLTFNRFAMRIGMGEYQLLKALSDAHRIDLIEHAVIQIFENYHLENLDSFNHKLTKYALASKVGSFFGILECWLKTEKGKDINELLDSIDDIAELTKELNFFI